MFKYLPGLITEDVEIRIQSGKPARVLYDVILNKWWCDIE